MTIERYGPITDHLRFKRGAIRSGNTCPLVCSLCIMVLIMENRNDVYLHPWQELEKMGREDEEVTSMSIPNFH